MRRDLRAPPEQSDSAGVDGNHKHGTQGHGCQHLSNLKTTRGDTPCVIVKTKHEVLMHLRPEEATNVGVVLMGPSSPKSSESDKTDVTPAEAGDRSKAWRTMLQKRMTIGMVRDALNVIADTINGSWEGDLKIVP